MCEKYRIDLDFSDTGYVNFESFLQVNREEIYLAIIEMFKTFAETETTTGYLFLTICAEEQTRKIELTFSDWQYPVLRNDILPFFSSEQREDYETCEYICQIHKKLKSKLAQTLSV